MLFKTRLIHNYLNACGLLMQNMYKILCVGGVGFDINCGVRLIRTNLTEKDVSPVKEQLAQVVMCCIHNAVGTLWNICA